jgi:hypothetical protein
MNDVILLAQGNQINPIPRQQWEQHLAVAPQHIRARLDFMTAAHHQVRYFVVQEIIRRGQPIPPPLIAQALGLPLARVATILDELEENLFFLARNDAGDVAWAYPVTADTTPHRLTFSSGEQLYAA